MPITDTLMALGGYSITLNPETPPEVRAIYEPEPSVHAMDTIVVTASRLGDGALTPANMTEFKAQILDESRFTGRIEHLRRAGPGEQSTISGPSILAGLGDANGKGTPPQGTLGAGGATTQLFNRMGAIFGGTRAQDGGFNLTLHWTTASIGVTVTDDWTSDQAIRGNFERLGLLGANVGATVFDPVEYRAHPNGDFLTFDQGNYAYFDGDSEFIFGPGLLHDQHDNAGGTPPSYRVLPADITVEEDWSDFATGLLMRNSTSAGHSLQSGYQNFAGENQDIEVVEDGVPGTGSGTDMLHRAHNRLRTEYVPKYRYTVSIDASDAQEVMAGLSAGSRINIYDPNRAQSDSATSIMVNGHQLGCVLLRMTSMTYPIMPGMGVYAVQTGLAAFSTPTFPVADLSNYVAYDREPKKATLQVGTRARTLTGILRGT